MDILLLGGTGAMGNYLSDILSRDNHQVTVTSRSKRDSAGNVTYIKGNAHDLVFLESVLKKRWDAIVDFMVYSTPEFEERHKTLLNATNQYIFLSSSRVYAESDVEIKESSPRLLDVSKDTTFLSTDEYSLTKARQEDILKNSGMKNWTIIRPYITFSAYRLQLGVLEKEQWLYRALKGRTIVFSEDINSKQTTLTYGWDVATGISKLIGNSAALAEAFHITTKSIYWHEILNLYLDVLENQMGSRPKVILQNKNDYIHDNPSSYQIKYDRFFNRRFDNSKINRFIDTNEFTETKVGLKLCLEEFLKKPHFKQIDWGAEAKKDRITGEFTPLNEIVGNKQKIKYLLYRFIKK